MGNDEIDRKRSGLISLSPDAIDGEIKFWESIKSCNYSDRSLIFKRAIDVDNVLRQLYKAKKERKLVDLTIKSLYIEYETEEEKREREERVKKSVIN